MNYRIITDYEKIDNDKWSNFIINHADGNIFQTPEMYNIYNKTNNYEPFIIAATKENGKLIGILLSVIQKQYKGLLGHLSARSVVFYGPIALNNDPEILKILLKEYDKKIRRKVIYSQFRNIKDYDKNKIIYSNYEYKYEDHLNIIVNLEKSEDELWSDVYSKRRNEIRRATKENTFFMLREEIGDLKRCYEILISIYNKVKVPLPPYSFFENIFNNSSNRLGLKMFCAFNENKLIGCMLALVYNKTIYNFYAGADSGYYKKYHNDLIPWEVFLWGKKNGYKSFDFGGAGKPEIPYGVRDYKKKFGGYFTNYGRFEKTHKPLLYFIARIGLKFWKNIR